MLAEERDIMLAIGIRAASTGEGEGGQDGGGEDGKSGIGEGSGSGEEVFEEWGMEVIHEDKMMDDDDARCMFSFLSLSHTRVSFFLYSYARSGAGVVLMGT